MLDFLLQLSYRDWLALGALLLILEVFGAGGYLLCLGLAAACVGLLTLLLPLPWTVQYLLFAGLSILSVLLWWRRQRATGRAGELPGLNRRGGELLGREFVLHQAIVGGRGKIRVGDSLWLVSGPELPAGTAVKVVGQDGVVLRVKAA